MTKEERENDCFGKLIKKDIPPMSTEQAIEVLHELDGTIYETQQVALDMAIKALEQPTSDDCVSRQAIIDTITQWLNDRAESRIETFGSLRIKLDNLPSVTPTHENCKDCQYYEWYSTDGKGNDKYICSQFSRLIKDKNFYCAYFEKRGNENEHTNC